MGDTVWVLREGQQSDDRDHSLVLREKKGLDRLAKVLGVKKLSALFDYSIYNEAFVGPGQPNYFAPQDVKVTISALIEAITDGHAAYQPKRREELLEELADCLEKVNAAETEQCKIRLAIIS